MSTLAKLYRPTLALLTDLYQLTMAYAAWRTGVAQQEAVFHLTFRRAPFKGGYAIACGLESALELVEQFRFDAEDIEYLRTLTSADGKPLFDAPFLDMLGKLRLDVDIDAIAEGTAVFAHEPLLRVRGSVIGCMLLETPLLALVNFQTLIATKAARMAEVAGGDPILEFGLRRAQGIDGALHASRAAYVGGCSATSNTLAGRLFGIPVRGTHAHSWVMLHDDEEDAFDRYANAMPNNCVLLVDTYDTLEGVRRAASVGKRLEANGHRFLGVRLDSGDLAYLSVEARKILDEAGLAGAQVYASNDLDEKIIASLKQQGAAIGMWGVGTRLVTAFDEPALGGVYKLSALRDPGEEKWRYRLKLSEQPVKISTPGVLQVRRYSDRGGFLADMIYDLERGVTAKTIVDPGDALRRRRLDDAIEEEDLLVPAIRGGARVRPPEPLDAIRTRRAEQLKRLHPSVRRHLNPHAYPVGLEPSLHTLRAEMIAKARGQA